MICGCVIQDLGELLEADLDDLDIEDDDELLDVLNSELPDDLDSDDVSVDELIADSPVGGGGSTDGTDEEKDAK